MNVEWGAILVFVIGTFFGAALSTVGQVVATKLTKDKHSLEAKFVPYSFLGIKERKSHEYARGIILRNTGNLVERDIEARLKFLKQDPSVFYSVNLRLPHLVRSPSSSQTEDHMRDIQVENTYVIEHLSPKEEVRFDLSTNVRLVEIHFLAITANAVTRIHWEHASHQVMYAQAMEHVLGSPIPQDEGDEEIG